LSTALSAGPAGRRTSRWAPYAAAWLFVLPAVTAGVARDSAKIEVTGLALLGLVAWVRAPRPREGKQGGRLCGTFAVAAAVLGGYLVAGAWPSSAGTIRSYDVQAVIFAVTYVAVAVFALLLFDLAVFERVMWRAATAALWAAVTCWLISRLGHGLFLVSASHGAVRMRGTLSEPSAWAPVLALVTLLALRRRSWLHLALALVGLMLADSPTCGLVLAAAVPLYFALTGNTRQRVLSLMAAAVIAAAAAAFVQTANPGRYLASHTAAEVAVGRLVSGIRNVETGGREGHNTRFAGTTVVIEQLRANGWLYAGAGPGAENAYFPAKFRALAAPPGPHALWVSILFDFGVAGAAVLGVLMLTAVWRMRRHTGAAAILLPFFVASLINSAEGAFEYSFVALGIMLFAFGWVTPAVPARAPGDLERGRLEPRRGLVEAEPVHVPPHPLAGAWLRRPRHRPGDGRGQRGDVRAGVDLADAGHEVGRGADPV
jgi:hypothetical protein